MRQNLLNQPPSWIGITTQVYYSYIAIVISLAPGWSDYLLVTLGGAASALCTRTWPVVTPAGMRSTKVMRTETPSEIPQPSSFRISQTSNMFEQDSMARQRKCRAEKESGFPFLPALLFSLQWPLYFCGKNTCDKVRYIIFQICNLRVVPMTFFPVEIQLTLKTSPWPLYPM